MLKLITRNRIIIIIRVPYYVIAVLLMLTTVQAVSQEKNQI